MKKSILLAIAIVAIGVANAQRSDIITFTSLINGFQQQLFNEDGAFKESVDFAEDVIEARSNFVEYLVDHSFVYDDELSDDNESLFLYDPSEGNYTSIGVFLYVPYSASIYYYKEEGYNYLKSKVKQYCEYLGVESINFETGSTRYGKSYIHKRTSTEFFFYRTTDDFSYRVYITNKIHDSLSDI